MAVITSKTRFYKNEQIKYCPFLEASNAELLAMQAKGLYNFRTSDNDGFINLSDILNGLKLRVYGVGNYARPGTGAYLSTDYFYLVRTKLVVPNTTIDWEAKILGVNTKTTKEKIAIMDIMLDVENLDELNKAQKAIRKVDSVYEVRRKK